MPKVNVKLVAFGGRLVKDLGHSPEFDEAVYHLNDMGCVPLAGLEQSIAQAKANAVHDPDGVTEFDYELDPNRTEIWVDPDEFMRLGAEGAKALRHIVVSPVQPVEIKVESAVDAEFARLIASIHEPVGTADDDDV